MDLLCLFRPPAFQQRPFKKNSEIGLAAEALFTQIVAVTLCSCLAFGQAGRPVITPSGSTNTAVTTSGPVTNITTGTVRGSNAYNSFNNFHEPQGSIVNLFLPNGTTNLLNLVGSDTAIIDGTLNSILNGRIGGNVFFADPFGIVIGKNGVVNVGAFTALTPTASFLSQFFDSPGNPSASATASVLNGTVPITSNGLISVQGRVNASGNISLFGGSVVNSGTIQSGAVFSNTKPDFSDVVNVAGLQSGNTISVQNGNIEIKAMDDVENAGVIATNGGKNLNAGNIDIHAGGNVKLDTSSLVSASGEDRNSNGGNVHILAENNSTLDPGAVVAATGGSVSGNGGAIDFSAKGNAALNGGSLNAGASHGVGGSVVIDPTDLTLTGNNTTSGTLLSFSADNSITVAPGAILSSRNIGSSTDYLNALSQGNSGNITLTAPQITVGNGAEILAHTNNTFTPGNITLTATQSDSEATANAGANITIGNATIKGGDVTLAATATATANSSSFGPFAGALNDTSLGMLVNGPASVYSASSTSGIKIGDPSTSGNANITASGKVSITSTATSSTTSKLTGTSGVAYGESDSTATAAVSKNATITAGGTFTLNSASNNTLGVSITSDQQSSSTAVVAFGKTSSVSTTQVDGTVEGSGVQIGSTNTNSFSTSASATDFNTQSGNNGGAAIALGFYNSNATTNLTGSATADVNDVDVASSSTNSLNVVNSSASVPTGNIKSKIASAEGWFTDFGNKLSQATVTGFFTGSPTAPAVANSSQLGLAAGVSVAETGNTASTKISGTVLANSGKATISSYASDNPQISAQGAAGGQGTDLGGGIAVSDFGNTATTNVNGSAVVTSSGDASVTAEADIQNPAIQTGDVIANDWELAANTNSGPATTWTQGLHNLITGLVDGVTQPLKDAANPGSLTTSFVNTGLSTNGGQSNNGFGVAGSINLMELTNQSTASVTGSANVSSAGGKVNVTSTSTMDTFNVAGMAFGVGQVLTGNPGVQSNQSGGGSFDGENVTNTSTAYVGDGATAKAQGGDLNVTAKTDTLAIAVGQAGDKATQFGLVGTFNLVDLTDSAEAYIQSDATATASHDVNVNATNTLSDFAIAGALGVGGQAQVGVSTNWNQINQTTLAYIGDPLNTRTIICTGCGVTAGGSVNVLPTSTENVYSVTLAAALSGAGGKGADGESSSQAAGTAAPSATGSSNAAANNGAGGGSYGFGVSGEIAFNQFGDSANPGIVTKGFINDGAVVTANNGNPSGSGSVNVTSTDTSFSVVAGLVASSGAQAALAGAYGQNTIYKDIEAFTDNSSASGNGLAVSAVSNDSLYAVTAGGALNKNQGIAVAGAVNNNTVTNTVNASIGDNTLATNIGTGGITVNASEGSNGDQMISVEGTTGASTGGAGIGAAIDIGSYTNNVTASIGSANLNATGNIQVTSSTNVSYVPIAVSLGLGNDFGANGSLAFEQITDTTTSNVGGTVSTNDNLLIGSTDSSTAVIVAGGIGAGGEVGVSVAGIIPVFSRTTESQISSGVGVNVSARGNGTAVSYDGQTANGILLDAQATGGSNALQDYAAAGAFSGSVSAAGAVIANPFNSLKDDTEANIGANAIVNGTNTGAASGQSVTLLAGDNAGIRDVAGMLSIGGDLGVGVGFDQIVPDWIVKTNIGTGTSVNALGNVEMLATLQNSVQSYVAAGSGSTTVAGAGAASLINETSNVTSDLSGTVNAAGSAEVAAVRNTSHMGAVAGNVAVALGLGVGVGVSTANTTTDDTVDAAVNDGAQVTALGGSSLTGPNGSVDGSGNAQTSSFTGLSVVAVSSESVNPIAAGVAGSGIVGGQGSVPVTNLTENTTAEIDGSAGVNQTNSGAASTQTVQALATDNAVVNSIAGALGAGIAGLSAAVDTDTANRTVTAKIANANVNSADNVIVAGKTLGSITSNVASGSVGGFAGAGAISNLTDNTDTYAFVSGSSNVDAGNNIEIAASRNTSLTANDGSGTIGTYGLNGSVANVTQKNVMQAYVGNGSSVSALANGSSVNAPTVNTNGKLTTGTVDGLSVTAVGSETNGTLAVGGGLAASATVSGSVTNASYTENTSAQIQNGATVNGSNATADSSQGVNVLASDTTTPTTNDGAVAAAAVGVGGAADAENIQKNTVASIGNSATVNAAGAVNLNALSQETITSNTGAAAVGVAGASGTTADYSTSPITPITTASIGSSSINAGTLTVNAADDLSLTAVSGAASAGGVAFGAAVLNAKSDAQTSASINSGATVNSGGNVNVTSGYTSNLNGSAYSGAGSLATANAAVANVTDAGTNSASEDGNVQSAGQVDVLAISSGTAVATAGGLTIGIALAGGAALSNATVGGSTNAEASGNIGQKSGAQVQVLAIAASDDPTATATTSAISAGIGAGSFNQANAISNGTLNASVGNGANVNLSGALGLYLETFESGATTATVTGGNYGGVTVGAAESQASSTPVMNTFIGDNETITAPQTTLVNYYEPTGVSATSHMSNGSLVNVPFGQTSSAVANASPTIGMYIGDGSNGSSTINGGAITVETNSEPVASADYEGEDYAGVNVPGNSVTTVNITNTNQISVGPNVDITGTAFLEVAGSLNQVMKATNIGSGGGVVSLNSDGSTTNVCIDSPSACGFSGKAVNLAGLSNVTPGSTGATLGSGSTVNVGTGNANVEAVSSDTAGKTSPLIVTKDNVGAVIATNTNTVNVTIKDSPNVTVNGGTIDAGTTELTSETGAMQVNAQANSITGAADSSSISNSTLTVTADPSVSLIGATINSPQSITIDAIVPSGPGQVSTTNEATASISGFTGSITANATSNVTYNPLVYADSATKLTTGNLTVTSTSPIPSTNGSNPYYTNTADAVNNSVVSWTLTTVDEVVDDVVGWIPFIGSIVKEVTKEVTKWVETVTNSSTDNNTNGVFLSAPSITMNATLYQQGGAGASLTANPGPNNQATFTKSNITASNDGNGDIVVNNIVNSGAETVSLSAPSGTIAGTMNIYRDSAFPTIKITNNTDENLIINQIQPLANNQGNPDVSLVAGDSSGFTTNFHTNSGPTAITIQNNSSSNVTFQDYVDNPSGTLSVTDTGGSILGQGSDLLENNQFSFNAGGSVGTTAAPLTLRWIGDPNPTAATLSGQAGGNINLNVGLDAYETSTPASTQVISPGTITSMSAGGSVTLNLSAPVGLVVQSDRSVVPYNVVSTYDLSNISAGQNVSVVQAGGLMNVGTVTATSGNVTLTSRAGDIDLGSVSARNGMASLSTSGNIVAANGSPNLDAATINISALNGAVGSSAAPITIVGGGSTTVQASNDVYLTGTSGGLDVASITSNSGNVGLTTKSGDIDLGTISSVNGNDTLTSSGSILNTSGNPATVNITGKNMNLSATGGTIGTSNTALVINNQNAATTGSNTLTTSSAGDTYITESAALMNVNTITSSNGNVGLTTNSGDIDLGTISSVNGNDTLTSSGSILNTSGNPATVAITGKNMNLSVTGGTIGTLSAALLVNNQNATTIGSNKLTSSSAGDTYMTESAGLMNVNTITSSNGNVGLITKSGDIDLGAISSVNGNDTLTSSGSILNTSGNPATVNITGKNMNLTATGGTIGTFSTALVINNQNAATTGSNTLTTSSAGDTYITESAALMNVNTITSSNGNVGLITKSGDIDLGAISSVNGNDTLTSSGSILNTSGNPATVNITGKNMNLTATGGTIGTFSTALVINNQNAATTGSNTLTTSSAGDTYITESAALMNVNTITSSNGNVGLTTNSGDIDLGAISSVNGNDTLLSSGSVLNTSGNAATVNITGKNMNLTAGSGSIGNSTTALVINNQNAAATGSNTLTTSSAGDTYITESAGLMNVNTIASSTGNVGLTTKSGDIDLGTINNVNGNDTLLSSGSILNTSGNAATVNITGKNMNLTAASGSIGTSAVNLAISNQNAATTGSHTLTTSSAGDTYITESAGLMNVNTITSSNGNVGLTTKSGDIDLGTISSVNGNDTLLASGSILNTSGNAATVNITGKNMSLTATSGSIGLLTPTSMPLFVNNQNGANVTNGVPQGNNYLDASAYGDINITQTPGNLLSHTISSTNGNININVPTGSESLGTISVNNSLSLSVGGSVLSIGTITGTTGIPGVKAPSPNNVSLIVGKAGGTLTVNNMTVFQNVTTQADNTYLNNVYFTNLANLTNPATWDSDHQAQSLRFNDTGYNGGIASNININILPCTNGCNTFPSVIFNDYWTKNGNVTVKEDWLEFVNAKVTGSAVLQNYWENFNLTSKKGATTSWYFFLIGDKFERNADPHETVSPARFLQLPNHYTWLQDNTVVFPYLLNYFGLPPQQ